MKPEKPGKWTVLDSTYVIERPWLIARRDTVQLPSGTIFPEYYVLEYPTWINVIAITPQGEFVMVEQYRHGLGDVYIELCAGCAEPGEDPLEAARRELAEETGYTGGRWELLSVISGNPSTSNNLTYCYLAEGVELTEGQHLDTTEDITPRLLSDRDFAALLLRDEVKQALMAAPMWKYLATRRPDLIPMREP